MYHAASCFLMFIHQRQLILPGRDSVLIVRIDGLHAFDRYPLFSSIRGAMPRQDQRNKFARRELTRRPPSGGGW